MYIKLYLLNANVKISMTVCVCYKYNLKMRLLNWVVYKLILLTLNLFYSRIHNFKYYLFFSPIVSVCVCVTFVVKTLIFIVYMVGFYLISN